MCNKSDCKKVCKCQRKELKLEVGKYYKTRAGEKLLIFSELPQPCEFDYKFVGAIIRDGISTKVIKFRESGIGFLSENAQYDLIQEWKDQTSLFVNVYKESCGKLEIGEGHETPAEAKKARVPLISMNYLTTLKITEMIDEDGASELITECITIE